MSEVLSQNEIDALLMAVSSGTVETAPAAAPASAPPKEENWIAYDLTSQEKIYHGKLVGLNGIHERFSRLLRISLSSYFKKNVTVNIASTEYLKFGDYLKNVTLPTSLNLLNLPKLQGHMLLMVTSKLLYASIDSYYGGVERPFAKLGTREDFTTIENNIISRMCQIAVADLQEAWRLNYDLSIQYDRMESNPAFIGAIHSSDLVAVVTFDVEFESLSGPFTLVIQLRALDPIQQALSVNVTSEFDREASQWKEHWLREVAMTPLDVRVELGQAEQTLSAVNKWKVGDTLVLDRDSASPVTVLLEQVPKLEGLMGVYRGNVAVRLVDGDKKDQE